MINYSAEPYYDDFDESKHFHKILFKPGYAVQARELTQLQSIIQNQIDRFGSHIFNEGSVVHGGDHSNIKAHAIAIASFTGTTDLSFFKDKFIYIGSIRKLVVHTVSDEANYTIYVTDDTSGDILENSTLLVEGYSTYSLTTVAYATRVPYQPAMLHSIKSGIYFAHGAFVKVEDQIVVASDNSQTDSYDVHLVAYESTVTYNEDESLLDNAYGSPNYAAPGADRYAVELILEITQPNVNVSSKYKSFLLSSFRNGELVQDVNKPQYSDLQIELADRTYQESGNYTVDPFIGTLSDNLDDSTKVTLSLDKGSAFINGYNVRTIAPTLIDIDKARITAFVNNSQIPIDKGPYILVENLTGLISPYSMVTIDIHNAISPSTSSTTYENTKIGTATAFGTVFDSLNTGTTNTYKLFLTDININAGKNIKDARSFILKTGTSTYSWTFYAQYSTETYDSLDILGATVTNVTVQNSQSYTQLYKLNNTPVKTHINSITSTTDISYQFYKEFTSTTFTRTGGSSIATLTLSGTNFFIGNGILSSSIIAETWYAKVRSVGTGTGTTPVVGKIIKLESGSVNIVSDTTAIVTLPIDYNLVLDIFTTIGSNTSTNRNKVLNSNATITVTGDSLGSKVISLLRADGIRLTSVIDNKGNDHTSKYSFFTGQTDTYYDHCYIALSNPNSSPIKSNPDITSLIITFDYYSHSGVGPVTVDSYTGVVSYDNIQSYRTQSGDILNLANIIDFRPRRADGASTTLTFNSYNRPAFNGAITTDYEYYLPRMDRIVLSGNNNGFKVEKGIPAKFPMLPESTNSMTLYILTIPAYTFNTSDIVIEYVDNKRYTMRDIAKIDTRVSRLEYYSSLSLLEKQATDETIPSDVPGIDKFKNGILVDSFAGHSVGDVFNPYYVCSIDYKERYLRPSFITNFFKYKYDSEASSNVLSSNNLITLEYTEVPVLIQTQASEYESIQPFATFKWNGIVDMDPPTDIWTDTETKSVAIVNLNGEFDHLTQGAQGDVWSGWQTTGVGITDLALKTKVKVESGVTIV
jgi:hypothetical protein